MKNLDWPEAMWDAWISFEQVYGSVESLEDAFDRIEHAQVQITMRRAKVPRRPSALGYVLTLELVGSRESGASSEAAY